MPIQSRHAVLLAALCALPLAGPAGASKIPLPLPVLPELPPVWVPVPEVPEDPPIGVPDLSGLELPPTPDVPPVPDPDSPIPVEQEPSGPGIGGYHACTVDGFMLSGHQSPDAVLVMPYGGGLSGHGSGSCTRDRSGGGEWVPVTFQFSGADQGPLPCVAPGSGGYLLTGPFTIHDGTAAASTHATLAVSTAVLDGMHTIGASFEFPDAEMRSALHVFAAQPPPQPVDAAANLLAGLACQPPTLSRLEMTGTLDRVVSLVAEAQHVTGMGEVVDAVGIAIPGELGALQPDGVLPDLDDSDMTTHKVDVETGLAIEHALDAFLNGIVAPQADGGDVELIAALPYSIAINYRTLTGTQTMTAFGVPGTRTTVLVPNGTDVPAAVWVTVTVKPDEAGQSHYQLLIETDSKEALPIDVLVTTPPAEQIESQSDVKLQLGYEALSIGSTAPQSFQLDYDRSSGASAKSSAVQVQVQHGTFPKPLDVIGRYRSASEYTDLNLRMHMATPPTRLSLASSRAGTRQSVTYTADRPITRIAVDGTEDGRPLRASLANVPESLSYCSADSNACVMPWRTYPCACERYGQIWSIWRYCIKYRYCPIQATQSAFFMARDAGGRYARPTLNLELHVPRFDSNHKLVEDRRTDVTNLQLAQFSYDGRTSTDNKYVHFDTRGQRVTGKVALGRYDGRGRRLSYTGLTLGDFWAWGRELRARKTDWYEGGLDIDTKGRCGGNLDIDTGGKLPGIIERAASWMICHL